MAYVLTAAVQAKGIEQESIKLLAAYNYLATLTPPITETLMRTTLEAGQPSTFDDESWDNFANKMSNLGLDNASLTLVERSVVNTFREIQSPDPRTACCGIVIPSSGDGLSSIEGYQKSGTTTDYEIQLTLSDTYSCSIKQVEVNLTPVGLAPAVTGTNPFAVNFWQCDTTGAIYSFLYQTFAADPTGFSYTVDLNYVDPDGAATATYTAAYTLNL